MRIIATQIPDGSHELAIWPYLPPGDVDTGEEITTVCNLHRISDDICMVTKAHGDLSDEINVSVGLKALSLGYKFLQIKVRSGVKVSRWMTYWKTEDNMDYYKCNLEQALAQLEGKL